MKVVTLTHFVLGLWVLVFSSWMPSLAETVSQNAHRSVEINDLIGLQRIGGASGTGLSISPDGDYAAFEMHKPTVAGNSYEVGWYVLDLHAGKAPKKVANAGDPKLFWSGAGSWNSEPPKWSPDGQWIAYRLKDQNGVQIWITSRDGSTTRRLTRNDADVIDFTWSNEGTQIYFSTDAPRSKLATVAANVRRQGYRFDGEVGWDFAAAKPFFKQFEQVGGLPVIWTYDFSESNERKATEAERIAFESRGGVVGLESQVDRFNVSTSPDGSWIAWFEPLDSKLSGYITPLNLAANRSGDPDNIVTCNAPQCSGWLEPIGSTLSYLQWNEAGEEVYFFHRGGVNYDRVSIIGWSPNSNEVRQVFSSFGILTDCSISSEYAFCFEQSATHPRQLIRINLHSGESETVFDPNAKFADFQFGEVTRLEWDIGQSYDSKTYGYLVKPVDYVEGVRYPLIIVGYNAKRAAIGGTGEEYPIQPFAANGFAVLVHGFPLSMDLYQRIGNLKDYNAAVYGGDELGHPRTMFESLKNAIDKLDREGVIDRSRIGVTGFSTGIEMVNYGLINSDLFKAVITSSSAHSPLNYFLASNSYRESLTAGGFGRPGSPTDRTWNKLSLSRNASKISAPILINAPESELLSSVEDYVTLHEYGRLIDLYVFPDERHVKWYPAHRHSIYDRNLAWFQFWLRDRKKVKKEYPRYYERWSSMSVD